ncbi:uncharacterized membrane protein/ElaB/YqjD/DUF883 family membrane-anchored ribosome-binding protein [Mycoplasmoides fastidiosum]|uniref:Uncharacterized membrane protein/ElaB/YqjD/DUF883 family membrane-anchored ribosome-binding protein n=1 Tax=Mycoplasmoides fastidiosum TaxID=92758 RepID=A0ABU0LZ22_9BACT|nr:hypothetical protein [Mycoplasmoides fastidiosum]MDQ0513853.1 uncharacterized membrane protein/ElaB/YqjD/DUF883 family membrane-anchored ribosome-binding protein [Mycoplasmoides fastidiosum]UUD37732.1 hypothetical protein NPA10_04150 [Mycoplasmoides fastidiosum]
MKKLKFIQKNKLWLASLGVATTSSLVLAACGAQSGVNNSSNTPSDNASDSSNKNANPPSQDPKTDANKKTHQPQVPVVPTATEEQKKFAEAVLQTPGLSSIIKNNLNDWKNSITTQLAKVTLIDDFNQEKVKDSETALGKTADTAADSDAATVFALVKTLSNNVNSAQETTIKDEQKKPFQDALRKVSDGAEDLLKKFQELPKKDDAKKLKNLQTQLTTAIDNFLKSTEANVQTQLTALVTAKNTYEAEVKLVAARLVNVERSAFILDSATSELDNFVNNDVTTFLQGTDGSTHTTTLNRLVTKVRTGVLGEAGKDLWTTGNDELTAERNAPANTAAKSTKLYTIIVGLADQSVAWNQINNEIKSLTYNQALLSKLASAVNLLALHVENPTPLDVARLNAYLTKDSANVAKLLSQTGDNGIKNVLEKIANGVQSYQTYLVAGSTTNALAKLVQDLKSLHDGITDTSKTADKTKINAFKTQAEALVTKFIAFKKKWNKLQPNLWTTNQSTIFYPLLQQATALNQTIGVSKNYGNVLEVVSAVESLGNHIQKITSATEAVPATQTEQNKNTAPLMRALEVIITDIKGTSEGTFGKALDDFSKITGLSTDNQNKLNAIAKNSDKSGYVYTDLVNGTTKSGANHAKLSFEQLKTELVKLQWGNNKQLTTVQNLLSSQLRPNAGSQTANLNDHLATLFNNGTVLVDNENH